MLTPKQRVLLDYLINYHDDNGGVLPTYTEIKAHTGAKSNTSVHRLLCRLEDRGYIRRIQYRARGIEIIRRPDGTYMNENDIVARLRAEIKDLKKHPTGISEAGIEAVARMLYEDDQDNSWYPEWENCSARARNEWLERARRVVEVYDMAWQKQLSS